jgi:hypothetical protein
VIKVKELYTDLETNINNFLEENNINENNLIDIKYTSYGKTGTTALIIYKI